MTLISIKSALVAIAVVASSGAAFAADPVSASGSLTVNPTPVAPPPAPLAAPGAAPVRTASADPLAGALSNGVASPLTAGPSDACCPCRTVHRVVHRRVVRRVVRRPVVVAAAVPLVPLYPVVRYRPFFVARPVVVYRPPVFVYGQPAPFLGRPVVYGPRRVWRSYYRPGW